MDKRFTDQRLTEFWCTGKDSNLRTSLGGTDLQSVGFNHSPTCANSRAMRPMRFLRQNHTCRAGKQSRQTRRPNAAKPHATKDKNSLNRETKDRARDNR